MKKMKLQSGQKVARSWPWTCLRRGRIHWALCLWTIIYTIPLGTECMKIKPSNDFVHTVLFNPEILFSSQHVYKKGDGLAASCVLQFRRQSGRELDQRLAKSSNGS